MDILMEIRLFQILGYNVCMYRNLEQIKGYFTVTFFFFFAGNVFFKFVRNSIARSSNLLDITKNWLKKGQSLKKSSAFDSETNNHRPLTRTLVSKWKSCATNLFATVWTMSQNVWRIAQMAGKCSNWESSEFD